MSPRPEGSGHPGPRGELLTVRVHPDIKARLDQYVKDHPETNRSGVVAEAVTEYLDQHEPEEGSP